ncbi:hypothetical protein D1872_207040 [compost metagenome]
MHNPLQQRYRDASPELQLDAGIAAADFRPIDVFQGVPLESLKLASLQPGVNQVVEGRFRVKHRVPAAAQMNGDLRGKQHILRFRLLAHVLRLDIVARGFDDRVAARQAIDEKIALHQAAPDQKGQHQRFHTLLHAPSPPCSYWGSVKVTLVPLPSSDCNEIVPPCALTISRAMERPSPVPPIFRDRALSTR